MSRWANSRMSSVSHPAGLPDLFCDRSLGRIKVPSLLRAAGLQLTTLGLSLRGASCGNGGKVGLDACHAMMES